MNICLLIGKGIELVCRIFGLFQNYFLETLKKNILMVEYGKVISSKLSEEYKQLIPWFLLVISESLWEVRSTETSTLSHARLDYLGSQGKKIDTT